VNHRAAGWAQKKSHGALGVGPIPVTHQAIRLSEAPNRPLWEQLLYYRPRDQALDLGKLSPLSLGSGTMVAATLQRPLARTLW